MSINIIIMRGIPGSGKSTYAKKYQENYPRTSIVSADKYHINENGQYKFKPENIAWSHDQCLRDFLLKLDKMGQGPTWDLTIIVDNTNITAWEIAPYYRLGEVHFCKTKIIRIECPFDIAMARNIHSVPQQKIWSMYQTILTERLPSHWKEEILFVPAEQIRREWTAEEILRQEG